MNTKNDEKDVGAAPELAPYVQSVIEKLECEQKYAAMHGHLCALRGWQVNKLVYLRHKTKRPMRVELCPEALRLLREYGKKSPDSPYLLPILDADTPGGWGLYKDYQDALRHFNRELAPAVELLLPGIRVSSYTARHTWATLAYHMGLPLGIISQSLGHSSIRVTETYLKPFENERLDKANKQLIAAVKKGKWKSFANNNIL